MHNLKEVLAADSLRVVNASMSKIQQGGAVMANQKLQCLIQVLHIVLPACGRN